VRYSRVSLGAPGPVGPCGAVGGWEDGCVGAGASFWGYKEYYLSKLLFVSFS